MATPFSSAYTRYDCWVLVRVVAIVLWSIQYSIVCAAPPAEVLEWHSYFVRGVKSRQEGNLNQSIGELEQARKLSANKLDKAVAAGELGVAYFRAGRYTEAQSALLEAYSDLTGKERARYAIDLGNLAKLGKQEKEALAYYRQAIEAAAGDLSIETSARLNLVHFEPAESKIDRLHEIARDLDRNADQEFSARAHLNVGAQAGFLGRSGLELAHGELTKALRIALELKSDRLMTEGYDALAELYEANDRSADALELTRNGLRKASEMNSGAVADLLVNLYWREGRLLRKLGKVDMALAAYRRAVEHVESIRQDIPIEYEDGRSSYRATLEPIHLGLVDLLLENLDRQPAEAQQVTLRNIRDSVELTRQAELQDYLRDRCTVEAIQGGASTQIPSKTGVLYPLVLPNRLELLFETQAGIQRRTVAVSSEQLRVTVHAFANSLRNGAAFRTNAQKLYEWLLRPLETLMSEQHIHTLVMVPEGPLRLMATAALFDGEKFAIEKFSVTTVTGMSMTFPGAMVKLNVRSLVAGMSEAGPVVEKLGGEMNSASTLLPERVAVSSEPQVSRGNVREVNLQQARSLRAADGATVRASEVEALRKKLALPGVKEEVMALGKALPGITMLDAVFTRQHFYETAGTGDYRILHIASHGVFGGSADTSYIMAYDDLLTLNNLQSLLNSEKLRQYPIEILSLSACETADGNDRAPLGISGAAIRARAKTVLGTLWPVDDTAARLTMEKFYRGMFQDRLSKAEAMRQAQLELLKRPEYSHPFFWAPFLLVGNWE